MPDKSLKIVVEKNVPFVKGLLDDYADVSYLAPEEITPRAVADADAMIIRTRTRCNEDLLAGSRCRFIATATIGTDHIDQTYCSSRGIEVANAPGCNAPAVAQYVFASLMAVVNRPLRSYTIGIVGLGHVGSIVENWARGFGMKVLRCDPPRQLNGDPGPWASLDEIAAKADIVTFHVPYTTAGPYATHHMADSDFLNKLRRAPILINSSRGPVFNTADILAAKDAGKVGPLIVDCWEGEPGVNAELLAKADIATPHIAGYSIEGKKRASRAALDALTASALWREHPELPARIELPGDVPPPPAATVSYRDLLAGYDPAEDTAMLKARPEDFETLRNTYALRHETPEGRNPA